MRIAAASAAATTAKAAFPTPIAAERIGAAITVAPYLKPVAVVVTTRIVVIA